MTVTYDLSTSIGKCRLLAADTNTQEYVFSDEEWQVFLDLFGDNLHLAAAAGLDAMAADAAKIAIVTNRDKIETDPTAVGKQLRDAAAALRTAATGAATGAGTLVSAPDRIFTPPVTSGNEPGNLEPW